MYNAEQKTRFIRSYTKSMETEKVAIRIFQAIEKYELQWGADLCTKSAQELQIAVEEVIGVRSNSKWMGLSILNAYVKWCMLMKIPGACDGMLHVEVDGLDIIRQRMVANPKQLQDFLDTIYEPEAEETIDNIHRCYLWMAFGGIGQGDTLSIRNADVDFQQMVIRYRFTNAPIYREAVPAFINAVKLSRFRYKHPHYANVIYKDRVEGDAILRGVKAASLEMLKRHLIRKNKGALQRGDTRLRLDYSHVLLSGIFYRMYEREQAGYAVDFTEAAERQMYGKTYAACEKGGVSRETIKRKIARDYAEDYQRWKLAFYR